MIDRKRLRETNAARDALAEALGCERAEVDDALREGGLTLADAARLSEQVLGTFALPLSVVALTLDGRERLVPMCTEEPSVVAAAQHGAKALGEVRSEVHGGHLMTAQVHVRTGASGGALDEPALLALADAAVPRLVERGGGARDLRMRTLDEALCVVELDVDCGEAMGANLVDTVAEAIAPEVARQLSGEVVMAILTNLCARRRVRVQARVPVQESERATLERIALASHVAQLDVGRAVTQDKGVLNGVVAVAAATGNDTRAVAAGAHGWAGRGEGYAPLSHWTIEGDALVGTLELPLALGAVGGAGRVHRVAELLLRGRSAVSLEAEAAAIGLACNYSALRALVTEGIQRGHMQLHDK